MYTELWLESLEGKDQLGVLGVCDFKDTDCEGVNWFHMAQDMFQWWVLVNTVMHL